MAFTRFQSPAQRRAAFAVLAASLILPSSWVTALPAQANSLDCTNGAPATVSVSGGGSTSWQAIQAAVTDAGTAGCTDLTINITGDITASNTPGEANTSIEIPELSPLESVTIQGWDTGVAATRTIDINAWNPSSGSASRRFITDLRTTWPKTTSLTIQSLTITNGYQPGGGTAADSEGGAIWSAASNVTIKDSTITQNFAEVQGGGVYRSDGALVIEGSVISENETEGYGGGVHAYGDLMITKSQVTGNRTLYGGGGAYSSGAITVADSTIGGSDDTMENYVEEGRGGGLFGTSVTVVRSTVAYNFAGGGDGTSEGGGIFGWDEVTITNSTITGNDSFAYAVVSKGSLTLNFSTVADNKGGAVGASYGSIEGIGSIILTDRGELDPSTCFGDVTLTFSISDSDDCLPTTLGSNAKHTLAEVNLGALALNDPTVDSSYTGPQTRMPATGSPAIGFVPTDGLSLPVDMACLTAIADCDQRGVIRSAPYWAGASQGTGEGDGGGDTPTKPKKRQPQTQNGLGPITNGTNGSFPAGGLAPGSSLLLVNGSPTPVSVTPNATYGATGLLLSGPGFTMTMAGQSSNGTPLGLTPEGALIIGPNRQAYVTGTGFRGESPVDLFVFSTPQYLGTVTTNAQGSFEGAVPIPTDLPVGLHTLQANGYTPDGVVRSVSIGVVVPLPNTGAETDLGLVGLGAGLLVGAGALLVGARRRQS